MSPHVYDERVAPGIGPWFEHLARYERVAATLPAGTRVLDAGCGEGYGAALLAGAGHDVVAVDLHDETVESAQRQYGELVRFETADVTHLRFEDGSFDAVTCFEVIEHVPDPDALARELARVLRPGGTLFLSTPHGRIELLHDRMRGRDPNPYHVSRLTPGVVRRVIARHFEDVRVYGQTRDRGRLHAIAQAIDVLGLRVRIASRGSGAPPAVNGDAVSATAPTFRFSRALAHSAGVTFVEATR